MNAFLIYLPLALAMVILVIAIVLKVTNPFKRPIASKRKKWFINYEPAEEKEKVVGEAYFKQNTKLQLLIILVTTALWVFWERFGIINDIAPEFRAWYIFAGVFFISQMFVSLFAKVNKETRNKLLRARIIVPVYNEDERSFQECLKSCLNQSLPPEAIHVVDDASVANYDNVKSWFIKEAKKKNIQVTWDKLEQNGGKRVAQAKAMSHVPDHDDYIIIVTTDSDTIIDKNMVEEGLKPFTSPEVSAVAGLMVTKNKDQGLLARFYDLIMVVQQFIGRGAMSVFGNVLVNSGTTSFLRNEVIQDAIKQGYTEEKFLGREVRCSDDSYLTLCALLVGKTVFQPSAIAICDMPILFKHHLGQMLRWERGATLRGAWRLQFLGMNNLPGLLRQLLGWISFWTISSIAIIVTTRSIMNGDYKQLVMMVGIGILLSIGYYYRYFSLGLYADKKKNPLTYFPIILIACVWSVTVLKLIRIYATITCYKISGWGTRKKVEKIRK